MALKPCPECQTEVSTRAFACPKCGAPLRKKPKNKAAQGCAGLIFLIVALPLLIIGISMSGSSDKQEASSPPASPSEDASLLFIDAKLHTTSAFYGCPQLDDLEKIRGLIRDHDDSAADKAANMANCSIVDQNVHGTVKDSSVWHAAVCLRQEGEPDCVWLPKSVVAKD